MYRRGGWALTTLLAVALLAGCVGLGGAKDQRPTITLDAEGFLQAYLTERDEWLGATYAARRNCAKPEQVDTQRCKDLKTKEVTWALRDAAVFQAIIVGKTIDRETLKLAWAAGRELVKFALDTAL